MSAASLRKEKEDKRKIDRNKINTSAFVDAVVVTVAVAVVVAVAVAAAVAGAAHFYLNQERTVLD